MKRRTVFLTLSLVLAIGMAGIVAEPLVLLGLGMTRHSPCSAGEALRGLDNEREIAEIAADFAKRSKAVERDSAGYTRWEGPRGTWWAPTKSEGLLFFQQAGQEKKLFGTGARGARAGDVVLDAGAGTGIYTREALSLGAKLVIAIESAPDLLECLRRNFKAEIVSGRVVVVDKGVRDEELAAGAKWPVTTIDRIVAELKLPAVDFVKLDLEGGEARAISGARNTLARFKPRVSVCMRHSGMDRETVPKSIQAARPDYSGEGGFCQLGDGNIWPTVLYFR